jgi:hypothetical protein
LSKSHPKAVGFFKWPTPRPPWNGWQSERVSLPNAAAGTYILGLYTNTDSATPTLEFKRVLLIK